METINKDELLDKALQRLKEKRKGSKVFCVSCGGQKRTLRKWHNSYLCSDCWKIKERIGESLNGNVIDYYWIKQWDGKLPTTVLGDGNDYILDLGSIGTTEN